MKKSAMWLLLLSAAISISGNGFSFVSNSGLPFETLSGPAGSKISFGSNPGAPLDYDGSGWCAGEMDGLQNSYGVISADCLSAGPPISEKAFLGSKEPAFFERSNSTGALSAFRDTMGYRLTAAGDDDKRTHARPAGLLFDRGSIVLTGNHNESLVEIAGLSLHSRAESSPVPEPSVLLILVAGLVMLFVSEQIRRIVT